MRLPVLALAGVIILAGCAGLQKKYAARLDAARKAAYTQPRSKVWDALYVLMYQQYEILYQDERTGLIHTQWRFEQYGNFQQRRKITAEVLGTGPFNVKFTCTLLQQDAGGEWREQNAVRFEDELYLLLYDRLKAGAVPEASGG